MELKKKIFIQDIQDNQQIVDFFLISEVRQAETKAGKLYLSLKIMDNSGELTGRVWDNAAQLATVCVQGKIVKLTAQAQSYKNELQVKVVRAESVDQELIDISSFLPSTPKDIEEMGDQLTKIIQSIENKYIKKLLLSLVNDQELWELIKKAPAAKMMHHAYIGGLLEHTLAICQLVDQVTPLYPAIDRSLLLAGAVLHDIGKVKEFSFDTPPFNYTDQGRLVGHMMISIEIIQEKISKMKDFPKETALLIKHLILSHHGRYEFGSPALPMTREAFVLNFLDDLDAKMNYMDTLSNQAQGEEYQWSDYQRNLERFLFVRGHDAESVPPPQREVPENQTAKQENQQPSLWG